MLCILFLLRNIKNLFNPAKAFSTITVQDEIISKEIDYASIFKPVEDRNNAVLDINEDTPIAILDTNIFDLHPLYENVVEAPTPSLTEQINPVVEWVKSNKKLLLFAIVGLFISFVVYKLLQPNPLTEAKKAVEIACKCEQDKANQLNVHLLAFNNAFESAQFPTQIEAKNAYNNAFSGAMTAYNDCKSQAENHKYELRNKFSSYE